MLIKLWWGKRALASASWDINLLHYASIFCNCKQSSLFLQVAYLGKLQSVLKFSSSAQVNVFVAINIVAFASTSINSNIKDLWDHSAPLKAFPFLVNNIRDVLLGWKALDWAKTTWTTLFDSLLHGEYVSLLNEIHKTSVITLWQVHGCCEISPWIYQRLNHMSASFWSVVICYIYNSSCFNSSLPLIAYSEWCRIQDLWRRRFSLGTRDQSLSLKSFYVAVLLKRKRTEKPSDIDITKGKESAPLASLSKGVISSVNFSSVYQLCPTLCDPMNHSTPGLPVHHQPPEFTQTHIHRVSDAIQPSHPLSSTSPPAPNSSSIRVFSNESTHHIRLPKYWTLGFSISPSNENPGLISYRMDWLDLLTVQGTLKSLLQHHS